MSEDAMQQISREKFEEIMARRYEEPDVPDPAGALDDAIFGEEDEYWYLAGPMSGIEDFNAPAFREAAKRLREEGYLIVSPEELDTPEDLAGLDPDNVPPERHNAFLARDLRVVVDDRCIGVFVLEGWEASKGAALEVDTARRLGKPIHEAAHRLWTFHEGSKESVPFHARVHEPSKYRPETEENVLETADRLVSDDRGAQYGHPYDDFTKTAEILTALGYERRGEPLGPQDIPEIQIATKLSRIEQSPNKRDSWVDICGYVKTREMLGDRDENLELR